MSVLRGDSRFEQLVARLYQELDQPRDKIRKALMNLFDGGVIKLCEREEEGLRPVQGTAKITATPHMGVNGPLFHLSHTVETTDDLPDDAVGEAVGRATAKAWESGIDPAVEPFMVIVTFR